MKTIDELFYQLFLRPENSNDPEDAKSAQDLVNQLHDAIGQLNALCKQHPKLFQAVARNRATWPTLAGFHPIDEKRNRQGLRWIKLGENYPISGCDALGGKSFGESPVTAVAMRLYGLVARDQDRLKSEIKIREKWASQGETKGRKKIRLLPEFSKDSWDLWWAEGSKYIHQILGDNFENVPDFRDHWEVVFREMYNGNFREDKFFKKEFSEYLKFDPGFSEPWKNPSKKYRCDVRKSIKRAIKQAFRSIAKK